jgi:AraC-like DNA-binding protein
MYVSRARCGSEDGTTGSPGKQTVVRDRAGPPRAIEPSGQGGDLQSLLAALDELRALVDTDAILRRAVEIARDRMGIVRARIFMLDRARKLMLGTWGVDPSGAVVDEHQFVSVLCVSDREAFQRSENGSAHFTVFENCPILEHPGRATPVSGQGRVAKTPIRSSQTPLGMMFNDAGVAGDVDEVKQAQLAILCSMLGTMLDPVRGWRVRCGVPPGSSPSQRLVAATVEMLGRDPGLGTKSMAADLHISESRLAAVFKTLMGMSLVDYRNLLRLDRFEALIEDGPASLMDAAFAAGFGSYAQFHRVFRARLHTTPGQYLRTSGGPSDSSHRTAVAGGSAPVPRGDDVRLNGVVGRVGRRAHRHRSLEPDSGPGV